MQILRKGQKMIIWIIRNVNTMSTQKIFSELFANSINSNCPELLIQCFIRLWSELLGFGFQANTTKFGHARIARIALMRIEISLIVMGGLIMIEIRLGNYIAFWMCKISFGNFCELRERCSNMSDSLQFFQHRSVFRISRILFRVSWAQYFNR